MTKRGTIAEAAAGRTKLGGQLKGLAQRCRELSEMTAVPDLTRELISIAGELEAAAERVEGP